MATSPPAVRCFCETWHNVIYTCSPWWPKSMLDACEAAVVKRVVGGSTPLTSAGGDDSATSYAHDASRLIADVRACLLEPVDASILANIAPALRGDDVWLRLRSTPPFDDYPDLREYIRTRHRVVNSNQLVELLERGNDSSVLRMAVVTKEQHPCKLAAGAFFNEAVPSGTILGAYAGMLVNKRVLPASHEWHYDLQAPHVAGFTNAREQGEYVFHGNSVRNAMCAVNDFTGIADEANVRKVPISLCGFLPMVLFVTARACVQGEEACLSYGVEYRKQLQLERPGLVSLMVAPKTRRTETTTLDVYRSWTAPIQDRLRHRKSTSTATAAAAVATVAGDGADSVGMHTDDGTAPSPQSTRWSGGRAATPSSIVPMDATAVEGTAAVVAHAGVKRPREDGELEQEEVAVPDAPAAAVSSDVEMIAASPSNDSVVIAATKALAAAHDCIHAGEPSHSLWLLMLQHRLTHARETAVHRTPQPVSRRAAVRSAGDDASDVSGSNRAAEPASASSAVVSPPPVSFAALAAVTGPPRWEYITPEEEEAMEAKRRAKLGDFTLAELLQLSGTRRRASRGAAAPTAGAVDHDSPPEPKPRQKRRDSEKPRSQKKQPRVVAAGAALQLDADASAVGDAPAVAVAPASDKPKKKRDSWKGWAVVSEEEADAITRGAEPRLGDILAALESGGRRTRRRATEGGSGTGSGSREAESSRSAGTCNGSAHSGAPLSGDAPVHTNGIAPVAAVEMQQNEVQQAPTEVDVVAARLQDEAPLGVQPQHEQPSSPAVSGPVVGTELQDAINQPENNS